MRGIFAPRNRVRAASGGRARARSGAVPGPATRSDMAQELWDNPMGTDGFEFVEYTAPDPKALGGAVRADGFVAAARHRTKDVMLYRQGDVNFIVNAEPDSFAQRSRGCTVRRSARSRSASRMPRTAYKRAIELGAEPVQGKPARWSSTSPRSRDRRPPDLSGRPLRRRQARIYDVDFVPLAGRRPAIAAGRRA